MKKERCALILAELMLFYVLLLPASVVGEEIQNLGFYEETWKNENHMILSIDSDCKSLQLKYLSEYGVSYSLIPEATSVYRFYSEGSGIPGISIRSASGAQILYADEGGNFDISTELTQMEHYELEIFWWKNAYDTIVHIEKERPTVVCRIIRQPEDVKTEPGKRVSFTVEAEGENLHYQWQYSKNNGTTWINSTAGSAESPVLKTTVSATWTDRLYRCVIDDAEGNYIHSEISKLVILRPLQIIKEPEDIKAEAGKQVTFQVSAEGNGLTYQWQYSKNNGKTWVNSTLSSAVRTTLKTTVKAEWNGRLYRCIVTDENDICKISRNANLTII